MFFPFKAEIRPINKQDKDSDLFLNENEMKTNEKKVEQKNYHLSFVSTLMKGRVGWMGV